MSDLQNNPYLDARREWDERYGDLITRARNWRFVAFLCLGVAMIQAGGMIAMSMRSKIVPYVVAVDSLGRQIAAGFADDNFTPDDRLKRAALLDWISDLRTVTSDGVVQRRAVDRVYARIADGSQAMIVVSDFYKNDPPQKRIETETVSVDVESVLPTSEESFEIEWVETVRDLQGQVKSQHRWKGSFTITIHSSTDELMIRTNPLGIYVMTVNWARVF